MQDNALPLPGRLPNFKESHVLVLQSGKNVNDIHDEYEKIAKEMQFRSVSVRTFQFNRKPMHFFVIAFLFYFIFKLMYFLNNAMCHINFTTIATDKFLACPCEQLVMFTPVNFRNLKQARKKINHTCKFIH